MQSPTDIPGIEDTSLELLEAAGFRDCASLARAGVDPLTRELERANEILKIAGTTPKREDVDRWIRMAREFIGEEDTAPEHEAIMPVNYEVLPNVAELLESAPFAIPFPGRWLADSDIAVSDIVPGILLNRYAGDLEIRTDDRATLVYDVPRPATNQYVQIGEKLQMGRLDIDVSMMRTVEELAATPSIRRRSARLRQSIDPMNLDNIDLLSERLSKNSSTKDRKSRGTFRGVLHSNPWAVRFGALITLLLLALIPVAVVISPLLLLSDGDSEKYHWVRPWWILFPFSLPVICLFWLVWGYSCSCRICRQKLFVPKKHRKNAKAHHIPLLGHILPLIFHLLIFQWFRCTHCGTPVRLKK